MGQFPGSSLHLNRPPGAIRYPDKKGSIRFRRGYRRFTCLFCFALAAGCTAYDESLLSYSGSPKDSGRTPPLDAARPEVPGFGGNGSRTPFPDPYSSVDSSAPFDSSVRDVESVPPDSGGQSVVDSSAPFDSSVRDVESAPPDSGGQSVLDSGPDTGGEEDGAAGDDEDGAVDAAEDGSEHDGDLGPCSGLSVKYMPEAISNDDYKWLRPRFIICNHGMNDVPLTGVKLRYYYTVDDNPSGQLHQCWHPGESSDCAAAGFCCGDGLDVSLVPTGGTDADHYLELSFSGGSNIPAGDETDYIAIGIAKNDWLTFDYSNDYSYDPYLDYTETQRITVYCNDSLVWGIEP